MEDLFLKSLVALGPVGLMLGGVIWFIGRRLLRLEEAMDRLNRGDLLRLIASPHVAPEVKEKVSDLLKEVTTAEDSRRKKTS